MWRCLTPQPLRRGAIGLLDRVRESYSDLLDVRIIGAIGPRGDGYVAGGEVDPDEAADYHQLQVEAFAAAGVDVVAAYTITSAHEGLGISRAARRAGIPVMVGFTVETDGRLPDGTSLRDAVALVEAEEPPHGFVVGGCCGTDARHIAALWGVELSHGPDGRTR